MRGLLETAIADSRELITALQRDDVPRVLSAVTTPQETNTLQKVEQQRLHELYYGPNDLAP